jgi:hypothetical protein
MKLFLIISVFSSYITAQNYFVSTNGSDLNSGTQKSPFKTLQGATKVAKPNDTIYIRGGIYPTGNRIKISGEKDKPITFQPYKKEKVIFEGVYGKDKKYDLKRNTMNNTLLVTGSWLIFKNLEFRNEATSIYLRSNASHNRFENISIHDNYYGGFTITDGAAYNTIINCDSYNNFDSNSYGEHADGFVVVGRKSDKKNFVGIGNKFINCRAWGNSDDGFDLWMAGNPVTLINCLAFKNGYNIWGIGEKFKGNGNGFKLGVDNKYGHARDAHLVINCRAWKNATRGFDYNDNDIAITLFRNIAWKNGKVAYKFAKTNHNLIQNIALENRNYISVDVYEEDNSWNREQYKIESDIISFDDSSICSNRDANGSIKRDGFLELKEDTHFFRNSTNHKYSRLIDLIVL